MTPRSVTRYRVLLPLSFQTPDRVQEQVFGCHTWNGERLLRQYTEHSLAKHRRQVSGELLRPPDRTAPREGLEVPGTREDGGRGPTCNRKDTE